MSAVVRRCQREYGVSNDSIIDFGVVEVQKFKKLLLIVFGGLAILSQQVVHVYTD